MITNPLKINKTLPKISSGKVIDFWLSFYIKIGPKIHQKSTLAALLELLGAVWGQPALPWRSLCALSAARVSQVAPNWLPKAPQTMILSTYLGSTRIWPISLTPFWSIFDAIYFRIRFWLDFVSILGSEMDWKCNIIDWKSTIFLDGCCEWFFGVSSWRSRSFLEWPRLLRPSIFIGKHSVFNVSFFGKASFRQQSRINYSPPKWSTKW